MSLHRCVTLTCVTLTCVTLIILSLIRLSPVSLLEMSENESEGIEEGSPVESDSLQAKRDELRTINQALRNTKKALKAMPPGVSREIESKMSATKSTRHACPKG